MSMTKTGLPLDLSAPASDDTPSWVTDFAGNARKINKFAQEKNEQIDKVGASQADKYSTATTYVVGDYCIYEDELYKCETEITAPEEWDASKWKKTNVSLEIVALQSLVDVLKENINDLKNRTKDYTLVSSDDYFSASQCMCSRGGNVVYVYVSLKTKATLPSGTIIRLTGHPTVPESQMIRLTDYSKNDTYVNVTKNDIQFSVNKEFNANEWVRFGFCYIAA